MKKVIKLDQILEGTNKQDGLAVLALLEAALVYLNEEFPGANVEFLQSDNAAACHSERPGSWCPAAQCGK